MPTEKNTAGDSPVYEVSDPDKKGARTITRRDANGSAHIATFLEGGTVQFEADRFSVYRLPIMRQLGELGIKIKTMRVKGEEPDRVDPHEPPRPKKDLKLGDKTPELVDWFFKFRPKEARLRYGVLGYATRTIPKLNQAGLQEFDKQTGAPLTVRQEHVLIARRKTHLTETPNGTEVFEDGQGPSEEDDQ